MYDEAINALKDITDESNTGIDPSNTKALRQAQSLNPFDYLGKTLKHSFSTREKLGIIALLLLAVGVKLIRASGPFIRLLGMLMIVFSLFVLIYFILML